MKKIKVGILFFVFLSSSKNYFLSTLSFKTLEGINSCKIANPTEPTDFSFYSDFENEENLVTVDTTSGKYFSIDKFKAITYADILIGKKTHCFGSEDDNSFFKLYKVNCVYRL